jgi:hypothetical protein
MKNILQSNGFDVLESILDGYETLATPPTDRYGKQLSEKKSKAKGTILISLVDSLFFKVMHCDNAKDLWDKIQKIYK